MPDLSKRISENILSTCGIEFELLIVDNLIHKLSLAKAYNLSASKAKFDFVIFLHEDILFHTINWGYNLVQWFKNLKNPGILGVAGSSYLPVSPSDWWLSDRKYLHMNFFSNDRNGEIGNGILKKSGKQKPVSIFALDGMFLAMKKSVWNEFRFDESLEEFHGYDTSICLRVSQKYQNYFIPGILIEHFSKGYPNKTWLINTVQAKKSILPFISEIRKGQILDKGLEVKCYHLFLNQLNKFSDNWSFSFKYSWFFLLKLNQTFFSPKSWVLWFYFQGVFLLRLVKK